MKDFITTSFTPCGPFALSDRDDHVIEFGQMDDEFRTNILMGGGVIIKKTENAGWLTNSVASEDAPDMLIFRFVDGDVIIKDIGFVVESEYYYTVFFSDDGMSGFTFLSTVLDDDDKLQEIGEKSFGYKLLALTIHGQDGDFFTVGRIRWVLRVGKKPSDFGFDIYTLPMDMMTAPFLDENEVYRLRRKK